MASTALKASGCSALSPGVHVCARTRAAPHRTSLVRHSIGFNVPGFQCIGAFGSNVVSKPKGLSLRASVSTAEGTELDAIRKYSEVVPDTVIFDDFERFPPTAATVSSLLLLGITSVPKGSYNGAIDSALAYNKCYVENSGERLSCFLNKALVNVGAELVKSVPGRVSTEVDARLAYDTPGIVNEVHELLRMYDEVEVPRDRLLFKIPATWQGIEATRQLETEGIQTHVSLVYSFAQASAAAQAGASVIQIFVGRVRDWARTNSGDKDVDAALASGADPGIALVTKSYNYIHKYGHKSKLMAAAVRNKQDVFSLLGLDYLIVPVKVLLSLKESKADLEDKYAFARRLSPSTAQNATFSEQEIQKWDQGTFAKALGPLAEDLLRRGLDGYINNTERVEEHFSKIWPPPNV